MKKNPVLLETIALTKRFGGLCAVDSLDLQIAEKSIHGVIGPNGSGKSTMFNLISGVYRADSGSVRFAGREISDKPSHAIARLGLARTFQLLRIWPEMTLLENVLVGHHTHIKYGAVLGARRAEEHRARTEMHGLLEFVGLADHAGMLASELSIGQRRLLVLARALAMRPKLLLLDEPAAGLSVVNVDNVINVIRAMRSRFGVTLVVVEHILRVVMETCDTISVLDHGQKIASGKPDNIKSDSRVIEAYLGAEMDDEQVKARLES